MGSTGRPRLGRGLTLVTMASLLAMAGGIASAGAASAASNLTVRYKVAGTTFLKKINTTASLGPGTLTSTVNLSKGKITASLALPPATVSFKQFGVVPVTATTEFIEAKPTTGTLNLNTGAVHTTSNIILKVDSISLAGVPTPVPSTCESKTPAVVKLASQKGFSVVKGGKVAGTYTIPKFAHCGLLTPLLNLTIPGDGNTISLKLTKPKVVK